METANPETPFNIKVYHQTPSFPTPGFPKTSSTKGSLSSCISELSLAVVGEPAVVGELGDERTLAALEMQQKDPGTRNKEGGELNHKNGEGVIFFRCGLLVDPILYYFIISVYS